LSFPRKRESSFFALDPCFLRGDIVDFCFPQQILIRILRLFKKLRKGPEDARQNAAQALGEFRHKSAIPALEKALDDTSPSVYQAVRAALNRIDSKVLHPDSDDDTPLFGDHHIYMPKTWRSEYKDTTA